jgi:hypothetical protein
MAAQLKTKLQTLAQQNLIKNQIETIVPLLFFNFLLDIFAFLLLNVIEVKKSRL